MAMLLEAREGALHRSRLRGAAKSVKSKQRRVELEAKADSLDRGIKSREFAPLAPIYAPWYEDREHVALQVSEHTEYAHRLLAEEE